MQKKSCKWFGDHGSDFSFPNTCLPFSLNIQRCTDMEGLHSLQYQRYEDLFDMIKGLHAKYFSDMGKRLYRLLLLDKLRVAIEEVEYYCEKGKNELLMNIASDFSYREISEDKRWDIKDEGKSLKVSNKERSSYHLLGDNVTTADYIKSVTDSFKFNEKQMLMNESVNDVELKNMLLAIGTRSTVSDGVLDFMIIESINTLRTKMVDLDNVLCNPNEVFYKDLYDRELSSMKTITLRSETKQSFESWKALHLKSGTKEAKIERLNDYLVDCMIELFKSDLLKNVVNVKSRKELKVFKDDLNIINFQELKEVEGLNYEKSYFLLVELLDCPAKPKNSFPVYEPNKENIGRLIYVNRHNWTQEERNKFIQFILTLQLIQEEKKPKEELKVLNYEGVIETMNDFYFKPCEDAITEDYSLNWLDNYMNELMKSELKDKLAQDWDSSKSVKMACSIMGALIAGGVMKGTNSKIATLIQKDSKYAQIRDITKKTLADYIGRQKDYEDLYEWTQEYIDIDKDN